MNKKDIIFFSLIGIIIILCGWLIFHIKTEEYKCISKPLQYVAAGFQSSDGSLITCSCKSATSASSLMFNSTTTWQNNVEVKYTGNYFNFSVATKQLENYSPNK